jgi:hypothetical protein
MKIGMSVCLTLSILLLSVAAWAVEPLALYDDFKAALVDPEKWFGTEEPNKILEVFRGTSSNRLVMENRAYGEADTNVGRVRNTLNTRFTGGAAVTAIKATVRVDAFEVISCPTNPSEPTLTFARLLGDFFNTGVGNPGSGPGSAVDDVFAAIGLERSSGDSLPPDELQVTGFIRFCADATCLTGTVSSVVLGTVRVKKDVTLLVQWDSAGNQFLFQMNNGPQVSILYVVADATPPNRPVQSLSVQHFVPNCDLTGGSPPPRPTAFLRALFDDVFVNASAAP